MTDSPETTIRAGDQIAHYKIVEERGRGGMAAVYRATDLRTGRDVALKVPLPSASHDVASLRLVLREVRLASRLMHPHIVTLLAAFEHQGRLCLVLEFVDGPMLGDLIRQTEPLPVDDVLRHGEALAGALTLAHERGILHQDVTPNNILIAPDGRAKLTDFGLARLAAAPRSGGEGAQRQLRAQRHYAIAGTPAYLSPEQVRGNPLDPRTDVFSLGAVLYEMCTGQPAFLAPELDEVLDAILTRVPPSARSVRAEVPEELDRILISALAKERDARFATAADLGEALRGVRERHGGRD